MQALISKLSSAVKACDGYQTKTENRGYLSEPWKTETDFFLFRATWAVLTKQFQAGLSLPLRSGGTLYRRLNVQ